MIAPSRTWEDFRARWLTRRDELRRFGALVVGADLLDELLADVSAILRTAEDDLMTPTEAARECGYSAEHLARLVREGKLINHGRPHAPRIRRGDLPRKVGPLSTTPRRGTLESPKRRIARACVHLEAEEQRNG
jgi:hypothetical protein